jgi:hypothetical protein
LPYSESCAPEHEGEAIALQNMHNQFIESLSTLNKTKEEGDDHEELGMYYNY